jgi:RsiW-degrading membrane proteinase PrsW (M82 family)
MSIWWIVGAFLVGGYAGMLLHALLTMAATREKAAARALRSLDVDGLSSLNVETR